MGKITLVNSEVMKENISFCRAYLRLNHEIKIEANEKGLERAKKEQSGRLQEGEEDEDVW